MARHLPGGPADWLPEWWKVGVRVGVTVLLGAYIVAVTDIEAVADTLAGVHWGLLAVAVAIYGLDRLLAAWKWRLLFRTHLGAEQDDLTLWRAVEVYLRSSFLGAPLPSSVGMDAVRAGLVRREAESYSYAVGSVAVERILGITALLVCTLIGLVFLASSDWLPPGARLAPLVLAGILGLAVAGLFLPRVLGDGDEQREPPGVVSRGLRFFDDTRGWMRRYSRTPGVLLVAFSVAFLQQYLFIFLNWVGALALGIALPVEEMLWLWPTVMVASRIPVSVLGFGVREGVLVHLLEGGAISADAAVSLGLLSGLLDLLFIGLGGVLVATIGVGAGAEGDEAG